MGVLVGEYPTNLLLQKLPVAKYLSANVFCWGVVIACSAAAKDFKSLMVVRFLLGVFESCVQPSFIIMYDDLSPLVPVPTLADGRSQDHNVVH
jgi:predicted MFS family arabinose efflux permease